jgi:hypothetical protein
VSTKSRPPRKSSKPRARSKKPRATSGKQAKPFPPSPTLGPWDVDAWAVQSQGPEIDAFIRRLLENEGFPVRSGDDRSVPDGGVDLISTHPNPIQNPSLPAGTLHWWITSENLHRKEKVEEWLREHEKTASNKLPHDAVVAVLTSCGLLGNHSTRASLEKKFNVHLLNAGDIATWVNRYPALAIRMRGTEETGRWLSRELERPQHQSEFIWDESRLAFRARVENDLARGPLRLRLEGFAGIGKTRLALEVLKTAANGSLANRVIYYSSWSEHKAAIDRLARDASRRTVCVVVDECTPQESERLQQDFDGISIDLVTVGRSNASSQNESGVAAIERLSQALIRQRIQQEVSDAQVASLLAEQCDGFIKAASVLARLVSRDPATWTYSQLAELRETGTLFERALGEDAKVLELFAVFNDIGFSGTHRRERELVEKQFSTVGDEAAFSRSARQCEELGLFQSAGEFRYVSPHVLANSLALRAVELRHRGLVELFFQLPQRARVSMLGRLLRLADSRRVRELLRELLERLPPPRPLDAQGPNELLPNDVEELREKLAVALPLEAFESIESALLELDSSGLRRLMRRPLVRVLEQAAAAEADFRRLARVVSRLASNETEPYDNNARGLWKDLFGFGLARVSASNDVRLAVLEEVAQSSDADERIVASLGLATILQIDHAAIASPNPDREVKRRESDPREIDLVFGRALPLLVRLGTRDDSSDVRDAVRPKVRHAIRLGVQFSPRIILETLADIDEGHDRETRRIVRRELEETLARHMSRIPDDVRDALRPWVERLSAVDFADRLHAWLDDYRLHDPNRERSISDACEALAREGLREPAKLSTEFDWLVRRVPAPAHAFEFWRQMGRLDLHDGFLRALLEEATLGFGAYALGGYLQGALSRKPATDVEDLIDSLSARQPEVASEVTWRLRATDRGLARIERLARTGRLAPAFGEVIGFWGLELGVASLLRLVKLAEEIPLPRLAYALTAVASTVETRYASDAALAEFRAGSVRLLPVLLQGARQESLHFWGPLGLRDEDLPSIVELVIASLTDELGFSVVDELGHWLREAVGLAPRVWPRVAEALRRNGRLRFSFSAHFSPDQRAVDDVLLPWARAVAWGPELLAAVCAVTVSPLMTALLENFENDPLVPQVLSRRHLFPGSSPLDREDFLRERLAELDEFERAPALRSWAKRQRQTIRAQLLKAKAA